MNRNLRDRLRDRMLSVPDEMDEDFLPWRFKEARPALVETLEKLQTAGIPNETIVTVMLVEMLPRLVHQRGPHWAAAMLARIAHNIHSATEYTGPKQWH